MYVHTYTYVRISVVASAAAHNINATLRYPLCVTRKVTSPNKQHSAKTNDIISQFSWIHIVFPLLMIITSLYKCTAEISLKA